MGVAEPLLDIMLAARVMDLDSGIAERHRGQGVRGGSTLYALHRGFKGQGQIYWVSGERWNRQTREREITDLLYRN